MARKSEALKAAETKIEELTKALAAQVERAKAAEANASHTWTVWAGKPGEKQSPWVKANVCIALFSGPNVVAQVRGLKVGEHEVVGGTRPVLLVPKDKESGFEFVQFSPEKVQIEGFKFPLDKAEVLAAHVLRKARDGRLMTQYPVRFESHGKPMAKKPGKPEDKPESK